MKQDYSGPLGKFEYDDTEFQLMGSYLKYIGPHKDGTKIDIPIGIKDCNRMFMKSPIVIPPVIPDGVEDVSQMFVDAQNLVGPPFFPDTVTSAISTFANCIDMYISDLPANLQYGDFMFYNCTRLHKVFGEFPESLERAVGMFEGCTSLRRVPALPSNLKNASTMFWNCENLLEAPQLPAELRDASSMFHGCTNLKVPPKIPDKTRGVNGMFEGCSSLEYAPEFPIDIYPKTTADEIFHGSSEKVIAEAERYLKKGKETLETKMNRYFEDDLER